MGAQSVGLRLSLAASFLEPPYARRGRPAASSRQPSPTLQCLHPPFHRRRASRRATGHQNRDGAVKQPRPRPRRLGNQNTPAHTRAHAGQSLRAESEGASTALHSFPQRRGASIPRFQGAPRGPTAPRPPPPTLPQPPRPLHPHTQPHRCALHHDRQRRPRAGAAATPAPRRPPRRSDLPRSARSAQADRGRRAAAGKCRQLRSGAQGGDWGRRAKRKEKVREQKFRPLGPQPRPRPLPRPPPRSPPPEPRPKGVGAWDSPHPRLLCPERERDWSQGSGGGPEPQEGRVTDAHLPASGSAWKLPQSARGSGARGWGIPLPFPPPPPPHYARSHCRRTGLSVRPSSACISRSRVARRRRLPGLFF